jgi:hypothetical protein
MKVEYLIGIIVLLVVILLFVVKFSKEGFATDEQMHDQHSLTYQKKYNNVGIALAATTTGGTSNVGALGSNTRALMGSVQETMDESNTITESVDNPYPLEDSVSGTSLLIKKCEAVTTTDCSIFDNSDFTASCGVCIADPSDMGTNSEGSAWSGGLVLTAKDRQYGQSQQVGNFLPPYSPTVGTCPAGRMVATKGECQRLQNQIMCKNNATLGSPDNCSQCYSDGLYHIVEPNQVVGAGVIMVIGSGTITWSEGTSNSGTYDLNSTSYAIPVTGGEYSAVTLNLKPPRRPSPYSNSVIYTVKDLIIWRDVIYEMREGAGAPGYNPDRQGDRLWQRIGPRVEYVPPPATYIAGYLVGPDGDNSQPMDLYRIILNDTLTGRKPRTVGQTTLDSIDVTKMGPGFGQTRMNLSVRSPFSFVRLDSQEASVCPGSPFVTKSQSATLLNSDPCYAKGSGPGKYNLDCLQQIFQNNGCGLSEATLEKSGFPVTNAKASAMMFSKDNKPLKSDDIANNVYQAALSTATGLDSEGSQLTLPEWSKVSQFCTGVAINSPCDINAASGPLSSDCIIYLWDNQGENKISGATYSLSSLARSLFSSGRTDRFCTRQGTKAPKDIDDKVNDDNMTYWKSFGGVAAVKKAMSDLHLDANTSLTNEDAKAPSIQQCYGIVPNPRPAYTSTYKGVSEIKKLSSNTVLKDNITLPDDFDYYLSFDITPYGIFFGNYSSIIRITNTSTQFLNRGDRNPMILFAPNTTVPYIVLGDNEAYNWWGSGDDPASNYYPALPVNKKSTITIKTTGKSVMVTVAGRSNNYTQPSKRQSGSGYKFYASDNFFPAANALIENIMYKVNDTVILETPPAPAASTGPGQSL